MKKPIRQTLREFGKYLNVPCLITMMKITSVAIMNSELQIKFVQLNALSDLVATSLKSLIFYLYFLMI